MKSIICMFSKTPGVSLVKTRMDKDIGRELSEEIFKASIYETLKQINKWDMDYVVAVSDSLDTNFWSDYNTMIQIKGTLGDKLNYVYKTLRLNYGNIYFIGADSFHLDFVSIEKSIREFESSRDRFLIGKTEDGGFYLFGSKENIAEKTWLEVEYSKESTSDQLIEAINCPFSYLPVGFDLDRLDDLKKLETVDKTLLSDSQAELIDFILKNI